MIKPPKPYTLFLAKQSVASNVFVYTKTLLAGGMPQAPLICIFQCRLRIPSGRFLSGDVLRVVEDLYEVRSGCSIEKWLIERIDDKCESKYDQYTQLFSRLAKDIDALAKA